MKNILKGDIIINWKRWRNLTMEEKCNRVWRWFWIYLFVNIIVVIYDTIVKYIYYSNLGIV